MKKILSLLLVLTTAFVLFGNSLIVTEVKAAPVTTITDVSEIAFVTSPVDYYIDSQEGFDAMMIFNHYIYDYGKRNGVDGTLYTFHVSGDFIVTTDAPYSVEYHKSYFTKIQDYYTSLGLTYSGTSVYDNMKVNFDGGGNTVTFSEMAMRTLFNSQNELGGTIDHVTFVFEDVILLSDALVSEYVLNDMSNISVIVRGSYTLAANNHNTFYEVAEDVMMENILIWFDQTDLFATNQIDANDASTYAPATSNTTTWNTNFYGFVNDNEGITKNIQVKIDGVTFGDETHLFNNVDLFAYANRSTSQVFKNLVEINDSTIYAIETISGFTRVQEGTLADTVISFNNTDSYLYTNTSWSSFAGIANFLNYGIVDHVLVQFNGSDTYIDVPNASDYINIGSLIGFADEDDFMVTNSAATYTNSNMTVDVIDGDLYSPRIGGVVGYSTTGYFFGDYLYMDDASLMTVNGSAAFGPFVGYLDGGIYASTYAKGKFHVDPGNERFYTGMHYDEIHSSFVVADYVDDEGVSYVPDHLTVLNPVDNVWDNPLPEEVQEYDYLDYYFDFYYYFGERKAEPYNMTKIVGGYSNETDSYLPYGYETSDLLLSNANDLVTILSKGYIEDYNFNGYDFYAYYDYEVPVYYDYFVEESGAFPEMSFAYSSIFLEYTDAAKTEFVQTWVNPFQISYMMDLLNSMNFEFYNDPYGSYEFPAEVVTLAEKFNYLLDWIQGEETPVEGWELIQDPMQTEFEKYTFEYNSNIWIVPSYVFENGLDFVNEATNSLENANCNADFKRDLAACLPVPSLSGPLLQQGELPADTTAPVATITPVNESTNVAREFVATVNFNEPIYIDGVLATALNIVDHITLETNEGVVPVTYTASPDGKVFTLTPSYVVGMTTYYVKFDGNLKDAAGNAVATPINHYFITEPIDLSAPTYTIDPVDLSRDISVDQIITVTFDKAVFDYNGDPFTLAELQQTVRIYSAMNRDALLAGDKTLISGTYSIDDTQSIITFEPDHLDEITMYFIQFEKDIMSGSNVVAEQLDHISEFTTVMIQMAELNLDLSKYADTIEVNSEYSLPEFQAYEIMDSNITYLDNGLVTFEDSIDPTVLGVYQVVYTLISDGQTLTKTYTLRVVDTEAPVIDGYSVAEMYIDEIYDFEFTVTDNYDAREDILFTVNKDIVTDLGGEYTVLFTATDTSGNKSTFEQTIRVIKPIEETVKIVIDKQIVEIKVNESEVDLHDFKQYYSKIDVDGNATPWKEYTPITDLTIQPGEIIQIKLVSPDGSETIRQINSDLQQEKVDVVQSLLYTPEFVVEKEPLQTKVVYITETKVVPEQIIKYVELTTTTYLKSAYLWVPWLLIAIALFIGYLLGLIGKKKVEESSVLMKDVALRANVSLSTVSKYMNNKLTVRPETAKKIDEAIKELNYQKPESK